MLNKQYLLDTNAKIPNVCEAFGITYISMFDFMREQNFKF